ncbi:hypothetical protein [Hymenobacter pini]|uniref:hypothetical protein n=1 Tax=Hymenobacter pini TaxID=2880879 RepID=UPI001CF1E5A7|nr:hypothetical protein [Hymenobacter pini]MCA8831985.1 hypothetical protein [Hymenobacter pini]
MGATEEPQDQPNLPLVRPATLTDQELWLLCERYGISFTPPTARDMQFAGIIKALEELAEHLGHRPR